MKRIIQVYKQGSHWKQSPPGIGDFIRGTCGLFEKLRNTELMLLIDINQSGFANWIRPDPNFFSTEQQNLSLVEEYFTPTQHLQLHGRITEFRNSPASALPLTTNLGNWDQRSLKRDTKRFIRNFYNFVEPVNGTTEQITKNLPYVVLSVRCGDLFFKSTQDCIPNELKSRLFSIIEKHILPKASAPVVAVSDCHQLKMELAERYAFRTSELIPQHGAFGDAFSTCVDLNLLKNSSFNYHINLWSDWWSGFSHYTCLIFDIPSVNFRNPYFHKEVGTTASFIPHSIRRFLKQVG